MLSIIGNPTHKPAEEIRLEGVQQLASAAILELKSALIETFRAVWTDPAVALETMGTAAANTFAQHADGVQFIIRAILRANRDLAESPEQYADAMAGSAAYWVATNMETPLALAVLEQFPINEWMPPVEYTTNPDGTIKL